MVIIDVFHKHITVTYKNHLFSKACFLLFAFGLVTVILPFMLAYRSKGLWLKRDFFNEQPNVKFKGEYIFVGSTTNEDKPFITCSSFPFYEKAFEVADKCSTIKVKETDINFDDKVDELHLQLDINLPLKTMLNYFFIIVPIDYRLHDLCPLHMQSVIIVQQPLSTPTMKHVTIGEVRIKQSVPLPCIKNEIDSTYNTSVIKNLQDIDSYKVSHIVTSYSLRNITTRLTNTYTTFNYGTSNLFHLELLVRYPEDIVHYKTGFWQVIKWAWIQYYAIFVIISWIVSLFKNYIFNKRLVLFYEVNPLKKRQ